MKYIITCLLIGLSLSLNAQEAQKTNDTTDAQETREVPRINEEEKIKVISGMKDYEEVQEALIVQQDEIKKVSLALIVKQGTKKGRARELGEHFLNRAMTHFDAESKSGENAGKSVYNYMISVCTDRDVITMGTKIPGAETISW
ncbi:MAG: hypothetical protein V5A51_12960 [Bacteroidales bacterium]|nr:hypothetical protein [Bacteroidales bacterium]MBS3775720.1 hypothetical protein [Bacteroidales bacterium]